MATPQNVIDIASREVGYYHGPRDLGGSKYGIDYASRNGTYFGESGVPYCDMFVSWVLRSAGMPWDNAYVPGREADARRRGLMLSSVYDAQPGDLVTFDWDDDGESDHIGIVVTNGGTTLSTIEGNTSLGYGSQNDGGHVARRVRAWDNVAHVIRPPYDGVQAVIAPGDITPIQRAVHAQPDNVCGPDTRARVLAVASASQWGGQSFPFGVAFTQAVVGAVADGVWGEQSEECHDACVEAIQAAVGAAVDGIWGPETNALVETALAGAEQA